MFKIYPLGRYFLTISLDMKNKEAKPQEASGFNNFICWIFFLHILHICPLNGKAEFYYFQRGLLYFKVLYKLNFIDFKFYSFNFVCLSKTVLTDLGTFYQ